MIPFAGGSYTLTSRKASVQRSVNMFPEAVEADGSAYLKSVPGLRLFADIGTPVRALKEANGRLFAVGRSAVYEVSMAGIPDMIGSLATTSGAVSMAAGLDYVALVDGTYGYALKLSSNAFSQISDTDFYGATQVGYLDTRFIFNRPGTRQFYISAQEDPHTYDALQFASAESTPENLLGLVVDHRQILLLKPTVIELWDPAGNSANFPFARNPAAVIDTGVLAPFAAAALDNSLFWLGSDRLGGGVVWRLDGYTPVRVSTHAVEEAIQGAIAKGYEVQKARAFGYQQQGHSFYCLQVPGLDTTWVFDAATRQWHERAELIAGAYSPHRGTTHAYCFGKHFIGSDDGKIYELLPGLYTNAGDILVRDRISPHMKAPTLEPVSYSRFQLDCEVGQGLPGGGEAKVLLRYSNNGEAPSGNHPWLTRSLGAIGERNRQVTWHRLGQARDRVWQVRCTDDVDFTIIGAV